ncbi:MAG: nickel-dependent lactate racemase [Candidatus Hydrogenedentes bacterium]|nr:nickel-dependent lactate racemase [Candidatus Hydrogenedentota bacterium]
MRIQAPYGSSIQHAEAPWLQDLGTLDIAGVPELSERERAIAHAIENPIGLDRNLYTIVRPGERVAIICSDAFRNTAVDIVLPILVDGLNRCGIRDEDILFVFASGTHRPPTPEEQARILGPDMYQRFRMRAFTHDPRDEAMLVTLGVTSRGTRVEINRRVWECDRIIATGAVVMHYFGGFGGGRKSILPGISSARTIAQNHAMNLHPSEDALDPAVRIAAMDGNPVAEDMLEGARLLGVDYVINTVLNRHAQIAGIFAGELEAAHRRAADFARSLYAVPIAERADLVVAASPATRNFVQTHKALYNAYQAMRPGGRIILLAPCPEGLGGEAFVKWLRLGTRAEIIRGLRRESEINGQTALSTVEKAPSAILITELDDEAVGLLGSRKAADLPEAIAAARAMLEGDAGGTCYVMPSAAYTVPFLTSGGEGGGPHA